MTLPEQKTRTVCCYAKSEPSLPQGIRRFSPVVGLVTNNFFSFTDIKSVKGKSFMSNL
jgi:hypothetical protein